MAEQRLDRNYGLVYIDKDDKHFLYKSFFSLDDILKTLENDDYFKSIEKKAINIIYIANGTTYLVELDDIPGGKS